MVQLFWLSPVFMAWLLYKFERYSFNQALTVFALACFVMGAGYIVGKSETEKRFNMVIMSLPEHCQKSLARSVDLENDRHDSGDSKEPRYRVP